MRQGNVLKKWVTEVLKECINPKNVATSIVLAILLSIILYFFNPLVHNEINAEILSNFEASKVIENSSQTTLFFTLINTGTVPLRINNIEFMWYDDADRDASDPWHYEKAIFLDENEEEVTRTILQPNEKMKMHTTVNKPKELRSGKQAILVCPYFDATEPASRGPLNGKMAGTCGTHTFLIWN